MEPGILGWYRAKWREKVGKREESGYQRRQLASAEKFQ